MAKIIERGKDTWGPVRLTCKDCSSVVEYDAKDLHYEAGDQRDGPWCYVKCPVCGRTEHVSIASVPKLVIREVQARQRAKRTSGPANWDQR